MGIDFKAEEEFPPDDTGYGFDNIGDVLSVSPLLLEKYFQAAESIVRSAVPTASRLTPERRYRGVEFRGTEKGQTGEKLVFSRPATVSRTYLAEHRRRLSHPARAGGEGPVQARPGPLHGVIPGGWPRAAARDLFRAGEQDFPSDDRPAPGRRRAQAGPRAEAGRAPRGRHGRAPRSSRWWSRARSTHRIGSSRRATRGSSPATRPRQRTLSGGPMPARCSTGSPAAPSAARSTPGRSTAWSPSPSRTYRQPGRTFEEGIGQAMVAVLASPRFLFRVEGVEPGPTGRPHAPIDEYALASRLSYFLWSTMPDDELFLLAGQRRLRAELPEQVKRMLADPRGKALTQNFVGQWLEVRDLDGMYFNERAILRREGVRPQGGRYRAQRPDPRGPPGHAERDRDGLRVRRSRGPQHAGLGRLRLHVPERPAGQDTTESRASRAPRCARSRCPRTARAAAC